MKNITLALIELERKDWSRFRDVRAFSDNSQVSSAYVPAAVVGLFRAQTSEEAEQRYWELENHVVVQGQAFEVAEHLIPVLVASLQDEMPSYVRIRVLELVFQMVAYDPYSGEVELGNTQLTDKCRNGVREGLWDLYRIFMNGSQAERASVSEILEIVETDHERFQAFRAAGEQKNESMK